MSAPVSGMAIMARHQAASIAMRPYPGACAYCGTEAYTEGKRVVTRRHGGGIIGLEEETWCATQGCQAYHPHAYVVQQALLMQVSAPPGWFAKPDETGNVADSPPVLYETSPEEKRQAGIALQSAQSVMDAWEKLERRGYTLARRTKP